MIRIMQIGNDGIFNNGLRLLIDSEKDMQVIGLLRNENQEMKLIKEMKPDIVLILVQDSVVNIIKLTTNVKQTLDHVKIIYILSNTSKDIIIKGIEAGVDGFILNRFDFKSFIHIIRAVYNEKYVISGEIAKTIIDYARPNEKELLKQKLIDRGIIPTNREMDIIYLLYKGRKNNEIAEILQLSESSIRDYVSNAYRKIGKNKRKEVVDFLNHIMFNTHL